MQQRFTAHNPAVQQDASRACRAHRPCMLPTPVTNLCPLMNIPVTLQPPQVKFVSRINLSCVAPNGVVRSIRLHPVATLLVETGFAGLRHTPLCIKSPAMARTTTPSSPW